MNSIFPSSGGPRQGTPFGMPDLNAGNSSGGGEDIIGRLMRARQMERDDARNYAAQQQAIQTGLNMRQPSNIDVYTGPKDVKSQMNVSGGNQSNAGKNVVFRDDSNKITPYQRESLDIQKQRLGQTGDLGQQRVDISRQNAGTSNRRLELAEKIASGRATDEEKHEFRMTEIESRGDIGSRQIQERGDVQGDLQATRGNQALDQIAARISGQKDVAGFREGLTRNRPLAPTQGRALQQTAITKIQTTRPDLAKYLVEDPMTGQLNISQDTPLSELSMIQAIIDPKSVPNNKDINLPSGETKPTTSTTKPAAKTAAPASSKYNVTIVP